MRIVGIALVILAVSLAVAGPARAAPRPPELRFEAPAELTPLRARLERLDPASLVPIMTLVGLDEPGPPIRVVLAPEGSPEARLAPSWGVAYALGGAGLVVLIPRRIPGYPDSSLEDVLRHEIAHVLIARAAGRRPVPRWWNEGLAIHAAREWGFEDRARLVVATVRRGTLALDDLDGRFQAGAHSASNAYSFSAAFVRYLLDRHGALAVARIHRQVATGVPFREAFRRATGSTLAMAEEQFWRHLDVWSKWVPFLTSSATLWGVITALALVAFKRRRDRDRAILERWDEEDRLRLEEAPTGKWVH